MHEKSLRLSEFRVAANIFVPYIWRSSRTKVHPQILLKSLFFGDLFASYSHFTHLPPTFLNDDSTQVLASLDRALALNITKVVPNHCDDASAETHRYRLELLTRKSRGNGES